jgi:hypothetical protein
MLWSTIVYTGVVITMVGLILVVRPSERLHVSTRAQALVIVATGILLAGIALSAPTSESRVDKVETRLDEFVPVWQFNERHTIQVDAPPDRVFHALKQVRADEIFLFRTLTWIRRGGRPVPQSILNAGNRESLIDVALKGGFVRLAEDAPRELVIGTVVAAPRGARTELTPEIFKSNLAPGYALAAMNFVITPQGLNASRVSTETRVFANSAEARRRFAAYWRSIYPGSAIIRRMWLRAVRRSATTPLAR